MHTYRLSPAHLLISDPVFFGTICGDEEARLPTPTALGSGKDDKRAASVGAAVEFSKANNLLGVFVDAHLLVSQPGETLCDRC